MQCGMGGSMKPDVAFFEKLSRFRLNMGRKSSMNMSGNRKSLQKGSSTEFSDFREYMPGDDLRRIDWNAYGRLDRLYIKEYMEEKEAVVSILLDTSASMDYGAAKKSETACMLAAAMAYLGLNNMDRVYLYDMKKMQSPFMASGGKKAFPLMADWLDKCVFEGVADVEDAVRKLPPRGPGVTIIISDFLQESFINPEGEGPRKMLRFLNYRKQKPVLLQVLSGEELNVNLTGTRNLIDMEDESTLRITLDDSGIRAYEQALQAFRTLLHKECMKANAFYALCNTEQDFYQFVCNDLRMLYDI